MITHPPVPVNLYVEHLASTPIVHAGQVYMDIQNDPKTYDQAAALLWGKNSKEYAEFKDALVNNDPNLVTIPKRLDAMTGMKRNGKVYVLRNVSIPNGITGYEVQLSNGDKVFVPKICGNLALLRAYKPKPIAVILPSFHNFPVPHPIRSVVVTPVPVATSTPIPVVFTPPAPVTPPVASVVPAPSTNHFGGFLIGGGIIGGIIAITHGGGGNGGGNGGGTNFVPPPCSGGSNQFGVCSK